MAWCRYRVLHHPSGRRQQHADATVRIDRMARRYVLFWRNGRWYQPRRAFAASPGCADVIL
jgi:hypothetical protein